MHSERWQRVLSVLCLLALCCGATFLSAEETKSPKTNRLARETSPYLLLHAHNPVDWYPWGPEAFELAKKENKPIFLSVGYSSCFWCHVMERLVFSNEEIAAYMNEHFVNIKVDREERPDVDDLYMTALQVYYQAVGNPQSGGWPLSMFLTPDGEPFAGGTYFPPKAQEGLVDFPTYLRNITSAWAEKREAIQNNAKILTTQVRRVSTPGLSLEKVSLNWELVDGVLKAITESRDPEFGGIDFVASRPDAPKFPSPVRLDFLQKYGDDAGSDAALETVGDTLDRMALGGIRDHLGGGFHRYSTDRRWHVPHFEKMLYDQAQLADLYVAQFVRSGNTFYRDVAEGIFAFVLRDMSDPRGGFYSALDAETDGVEGKYYVWSPEEVASVLGADADLFKKCYGMNDPQVFEHGYVLHLTAPLAQLATDTMLQQADLEKQLATMRGKLLEARQKRAPLRRDDKVLTSWNGLMIRALAHAGKALGRAEYTERAEKAARFLLTDMRDEQGRLRRTYRDGRARLNAYVEDYALLVDGLLALHDTTHADEWLAAARKLTDEQIELFWDKEGKGFFFTPHNHESLIARAKDANDSVLPAGNSVSVGNLVRLSALTKDDKYHHMARETLTLFAPALKNGTSGTARMALALSDYLHRDSAMLVISPSEQTAEAKTTEVAFADKPAAATSPVFVEVQKPAADEQGKSAPKKKTHKIAAKAYLSVDKLPAGKSCRIAVFVDIDQGWHINTNPAKPDTFIATQLTVTSKQGVKLHDVKYPPATRKLKVEGLADGQEVYEKQVVFYGVLDVPQNLAAESEELEIAVKYQACNDNACDPPKTFKLTGKLPVAGPDDTVKQINEDKFPKSANGNGKSGGEKKKSAK